VLKGATARRYATAIFEIAVEQGNVDRWRDDVRQIAEYFGNRRLLFVLREPKIPAQRKEAIVRDLLAAKIQPEALNAALLLVERGLADLAPAIAAHFEKLYNDYRGQAVAQVTTAIPLDDDLRAQITGELRQMTGKRILLEERVDPSILGGAIARVGDTLIDGSLRRRFILLRQQIASGAFGGPDEGLAASLAGPNDGGGTGGAPVTGGPAPAGPATSTEMAPRPARPADAPRLGPRSSAGNPPSPQPRPQQGQGQGKGQGGQQGGRPRRRRR
jgi:F-type H+-transporting ATPase subunit delta